MIAAVRVVATLVGAAILTAVAHVNIRAAGTPFCYIAISVGTGVVTASIVIGLSIDTDRARLVVALICTIVAGEAFNLIVTSERLIEQREAEQAPLRGAQEKHAKADDRVAKAQKAVD